MDKSVNNIDDVEDDTMSSVYVAWRKISISYVIYYFNFFLIFNVSKNKFPNSANEQQKAFIIFTFTF